MATTRIAADRKSASGEDEAIGAAIADEDAHAAGGSSQEGGRPIAS